MKSSKDGNSLRLIAILLVAVTLVFTVGFAAGGWKSDDTPNEPNSGDTGNTNGDTDGNTGTNDPLTPPEETVPPAPVIPDFVSYLTGLEITEEMSLKKPLCYVIDATQPLYGVAASEMVIEIPTENGMTRLVAYVNADVSSQPKIGAIEKTRDYISNMVSFFGGLLVSNGCDDIVDYESIDDKGKTIDLSQHVGYYYTEQGKYVYTNANLMEALAMSNGVSLTADKLPNIPFSFVEFGADNVKSDVAARNIKITYSDTTSTSFSYSRDESYTLSKNGTVAIDSRTGDVLSYENVFVLFADAVTHERMDGTETVIDTDGSGLGYYFTEGTQYNIRWYCEEGGSLVFLDESGNELIVNRGTSYIAYAKSTMFDSIIIE